VKQGHSKDVFRKQQKNIGKSVLIYRCQKNFSGKAYKKMVIKIEYSDFVIDVILCS